MNDQRMLARRRSKISKLALGATVEYPISALSSPSQQTAQQWNDHTNTPSTMWADPIRAG